MTVAGWSLTYSSGGRWIRNRQREAVDQNRQMDNIRWGYIQFKPRFKRDNNMLYIVLKNKNTNRSLTFNRALDLAIDIYYYIRFAFCVNAPIVLVWLDHKLVCDSIFSAHVGCERSTLLSSFDKWPGEEKKSSTRSKEEDISYFVCVYRPSETFCHHRLRRTTTVEQLYSQSLSGESQVFMTATQHTHTNLQDKGITGKKVASVTNSPPEKYKYTPRK